MSRPRLLLHTCCAPCSGFLVKELSKDFSVTIFYFNPNIYPDAEFKKRLTEAEQYFKRQGVDFIEAPYERESWLELVAGLEHEPERGRRCKLCYWWRLKTTAQYAPEHGFSHFASTLAISPHKDARAINNLGRALALKYGIKFLAGDWKKNDGFKRAMILSHREDFYHQDYCGCEFSIN